MADFGLDHHFKGYLFDGIKNSDFNTAIAVTTTIHVKAYWVRICSPPEGLPRRGFWRPPWEGGPGATISLIL